jgi:hypothetical protein
MTCEHLDVISGDNQLDKFPTLATLEDLSPSDDDFDRSSSSVDKQPTEEHHVHVHDDDEFETKTSPVTGDDVTRQIGDVERPSVYEETMTSLSRETEQPSAIDEV